jgi:acetylornithine deacetylase/succinyl-diaminopimelate desuccinylase-like protein
VTTPATSAVGDAAVDLTEALVRLDTVNPGLVPGAAGEAHAVEHLRLRLAAAGFRCELIHPPGRADRPSLVATRGRPRAVGDNAGRSISLLLNGHLDTVGVDGMADPFDATVVGDRRAGRMYGRGTCDMKAGVAAMVCAAEGWAAGLDHGTGDSGDSGDSADRAVGAVTLVLSADEEDASAGTDAVVEALRERDGLPDACIVGEPTWLDLAVAHRGFAVVEVELRGRAAHSSRPQDGVNAVAHLGRLLTAVEAYDAELAARTAHAVAGHGSLTATVASGGSAPFALAGSARAVIERRTVPGERATDALGEVQALIAGLRADDPTVAATARLVIARDAWQMDGSTITAELSERLAAALVAAGAPTPARVGAPYWMESALWQAAGVPTIVCGPAGGGLHSDVEWVELAQVRSYAEALTRLLCAPRASRS